MAEQWSCISSHRPSDSLATPLYGFWPAAIITRTGWRSSPNRAERAADVLEALQQGEIPLSWDEKGDRPQRAGLFVGRKPFERDPKIAFTFGSEAEPWKRLGQRLAASVPAFSASLKDVDSTLQQVAKWSLLKTIDSRSTWDDPLRTRAAVLALQLALAAWWRKAGVSPNIVLGHGPGELAAACSAGIITAEEALCLVVNVDRLDTLQPRPARLPFLSAADGLPHPGPICRRPTGGRTCSAQPASSVAKTLRERQIDFCLEISPDAMIAAIDSPAEARVSNGAGQEILHGNKTVSRENHSSAQQGVYELLSAAGRLYAAGVDLHWSQLTLVEGRCVPVPTYPWQRQALWSPIRKWTAESYAEPTEAESSRSPSTGTTGCAPLDASADAAGPRPDLTTPFAPPRSALETAMAQLWSAILHIAPVGIDDNFFELGGDSLQATILLNQLQERLGETTSGHILFKAQTIRKLADHLRSTFPAAVSCATIPKNRSLPATRLTRPRRPYHAGSAGRKQVQPRVFHSPWPNNGFGS